MMLDCTSLYSQSLFHNIYEFNIYSLFTAGHFHNIYQFNFYSFFTAGHFHNIYQFNFYSLFTASHFHNIYEFNIYSLFTAGHFHNIYQFNFYSLFTAGHFHIIYTFYSYSSSTASHFYKIYQSRYYGLFTADLFHNIYHFYYYSLFTAGHFHIYTFNIYSHLLLQDVTKILDVVLNATEEVVTSSSADPKKLVSHGNRLLKASEKLVSMVVKQTNTSEYVNFTLDTVEGQVFMVGPQVTLDKIPRLDTTNSSVDIDLIGIAKNNNETRSAAVAFMSYNTMENLLKPDFFNTSNDTIKTMMSTVISATLPKTTNTKLTKPVNFTLKHIREFDPSGSLVCVYWNISEWIVDGCSVLKTNSSYTVCSCDHLSTFALIMQTSRPPKSDSLMDLLNLVCVIVGLVFFSLALLTFALCQWSPGVNNVARINICISLLLAHLLFLLTQRFLSLIQPLQVLCAVISGLLHFLFLSGFVWMFIEAVLLFICVKNLSQISSKKREVLSSGFLCVIGYLVALIVVCVSVGLVPEGYGSEQ
ncbi:adhesion G protein-coupled receptor E3-like [Cyprinus carpio]|uniref:Adhesion G protein-coupled receptor E3-like n=1 Tax=Cyprinus carpio TaxID=7962 RepID=A0A9Q9YK28_CYPCA|nr:adhesion G protein-coupled receptor E3-like [Cyprinus carpio]